MRQKIARVETDALVVGGGLAGCLAAVAVKRTLPSARVWLVERNGFLGGMATAGLVYPFMRYWRRDPETGRYQLLSGGLFWELVEFLAAQGHVERDPAAGFPTRFDPYALRWVLDDLVLGAGVELLLHALVNRVDANGPVVESCVAQTKAGPVEFHPRVVVDASGDADVAFHAGADVVVGRESDGLVQPATLNFRVANVDCWEDGKPVDDDVATRWVLPLERRVVTEKIAEAKARGDPLTPRDDCLMFLGSNATERHFNQTRVAGFDFTDPLQATAAEVEGRRQVARFFSFLRQEVPGFERAVLSGVGFTLGVRETRRVVGLHVLTEEELARGVLFEDRVALASYPVDVHDPAGGPTTDVRPFPPGHYYSVPFGCLVPRGLSNVLVAGRPISTTHVAHSATRVMPTCATLGHAAGVAAALYLATPRLYSSQVAALEAGAVQRVLREQGAVLEL
ncbi:MAG: FAD-dependent oxidoreductase [Promethearchaeota archaeon]